MRSPTQKEIEVAKALWEDMYGADELWTASEEDDYLRRAKVAIRAMPNPDHDMTAAVVKPGDDRTWAVIAFNAMIDAASPQEDEK